MQKIRAFLIIFFFVLCAVKVGASETKITDLEYQVKILEDGSGVFTSQISVFNNSSSEILTGFEFNIPFDECENAYLKIDNINIGFKREGDKVSTEFLENAIFPLTSKKIELGCNVPKIVTNAFGLIVFNLPYNQQVEEYFNRRVVITYPDSFPEVSFISSFSDNISTQNYLGQKSISITFFKGVIVLFGNNYWVNVQGDFSNIFKEDRYVLLALPSKLLDQEIFFKSLNFGEIGLKTKYDNFFSYGGIGDDLFYDASILKSKVDFFPQLSNNFKFDNKGKLFQLAEKIIEKYKDPYVAIKVFYETLIEKTKPLLSNKIVKKNSLWEKDHNVHEFSSLEYAELICSFAKKINIDCLVEVGYPLFPETLRGMPQSWSIIKIREEIYSINLWSDLLTNYQAFNKGRFNFISFGFVESYENTSKLLGMFGEGFLEIVKIDAAKPFQNKEYDLEISKIDFPQRIFSGEFFDGKLSILNKNSKYKTVSKMSLNGESAYFDDEAFKTIFLLPLRENNIDIHLMLQSNYFWEGEKEYELLIASNGWGQESMLKHNFKVEFILNYKVFFAGIGVFLAIFFFTFYIYLKPVFFKKKKIY